MGGPEALPWALVGGHEGWPEGHLNPGPPLWHQPVSLNLLSFALRVGEAGRALCPRGKGGVLASQGAACEVKIRLEVIH